MAVFGSQFRSRTEQTPAAVGSAQTRWTLPRQTPRLVTADRALRILSGLTLSALLILGICSGTRLALARSDAVLQYTLQQTYSAALRYVRVELGFEVVERDPEAAYLLFKYEEAGTTKRVVDAAIEIIDTKDGVRVIVRIPAMPSFHERILRDGLLKKLESDYGSPPPKAKPSPAKKAAPGGAKSGAAAADEFTPE